jgi:phosphate transport system substrate-binding protein
MHNHGKRGNRVALFIILFSVLLAGVFLPNFVPSTSAQEATTINGAGATFPYPLIDTWRNEYQKIRPGVNINYQSIGSGGGVKQFTEKTVDFGASDAPLSSAEREKAPNAVHIPETIGSIVVSYNLPSVPGNGLRLSGATIADIFLGDVRKWNDPAIASLNPTVDLPNTDILVVHRSDGSGTTFVWTEYLSKVSSEWQQEIGVGKSVEWPTGIGAPGNEGVANAIKGSPYTIGYIELSYALSTKMPYASIQNKEGNFVEPSFNSISAAIASSTSTLPRGDESWSSVSTTDASGINSYPIASFSYLLLYKELSDNPSISMQKAQEMVSFVSWAISDGQQFSTRLGYVPLPDEVVKLNQETLQTLTFHGQPVTQRTSPEQQPAGQDSGLLLWLGVIAAAGMGAAVFYRFKRRGAAAPRRELLLGELRKSRKTEMSSFFLRSSLLGDRIFQSLVIGAAGYTAFLMALITYSAFVGSAEVFSKEGFFGFVTGTDWNAVEGRESYGALPYIIGTLASAGIAMLIGVPISIGIATFISEISPRRLATPLSFVVELLAAVPSIIYGLWALFVFRFWVKDLIEVPLNQLFGDTIPLFARTPFGLDIFTAGIVLAIMIIPTASSISREVMRAVPMSQREAAYSLGATRWETVRTAVFPYARSGLLGASILGLGRAVGETMLVTMVIGNAVGLAAIPNSLFSPSQTLASLIANEFNEAVTSFHTSALIGLGAVLFLLTIAINIGARFMVSRITKASVGKRTEKMLSREKTTRQSDHSGTGSVSLPASQPSDYSYARDKSRAQKTIQTLVRHESSKRKVTNATITVLAMASVIAAIIPLGSILVEVVKNGVSAMVTTVTEFEARLGPSQVASEQDAVILQYDGRLHELSINFSSSHLAGKSARIYGPTAAGGEPTVLFTLQAESHTDSADLDDLTDRQTGQQNLFAGLWTLSVGPSENPDAEVRGQILPTGKTWSYFNSDFLTQPPGRLASGEGGIGPAIQGTLIVVGLASLIGAPIGVLAGIYLSEYAGIKGNSNRFAHAVRFFNDVLTGLPSIVIGIVGYVTIVLTTGSFSVWAGAFALSIIMIPVVVRVTEETLKIVPNNIREAAYSLGIPRWKIALYIVLPTAKSGVLTGIVLAISRITGETAPLIMTILGTSLFFSGITGPVDALPLRIWRLASQPYEDAHSFGWGAALILILIVLSLSIGLRLLSQRRVGRAGGMPITAI